jgi:hypothetical protein
MVFIDESKAGDYLLIAVAIAPGVISNARKTIRELVLPGQYRVHMKLESDRRRRQILSAISALDVETTIYRIARSRYRTELTRRNVGISALVMDAALNGTSNLIFELDETLLSRDRKCLAAASRQADCAEWLNYRHAKASAEPMLVLPDVIGWAWARGGDWKRRCETMKITEVNVN